jgi:hypothetical protein
MKERVGKQIGGRAEGLIVSTFHALGVRILRQEAGKLGLKPGFSILDAADTTALYQELAGNVDKLRLRACNRGSRCGRTSCSNPRRRWPMPPTTSNPRRRRCMPITNAPCAPTRRWISTT